MRWTRLEIKKRKLQREAERAGLHAEIQVLEEDDNIGAAEPPNVNEVFHQSLLDITTDQMNQLFTLDVNNENQAEPASQTVDNQTTSARGQTTSADIIGGTPSPRMGL